MENKSIAVFLPTRKGSQRVKNKNTRIFGGKEGGLLQLKLEQLIKIKSVDEVILSSNDEISLSIGKKFEKFDQRVRVIERPDKLALSSTDLVDLIKYVPSITDCNNILWTHVTSPFVDENDYENAIQLYFENMNNYDSLMSAKKFNNYLWSKEKNDLINRANNKKWPQTQDLEDLYEIDSAIFISKRSNYLNNNDRVGNKPNLYVMDGIKSFDIDWQEDFKLAELIYDKYYRK
ncbi:MAG: acylneuraminate cytidylyltransferase family protein [Bacteroidota bacterium]